MSDREIGIKRELLREKESEPCEYLIGSRLVYLLVSLFSIHYLVFLKWRSIRTGKNEKQEKG